MSAVIRDVPIDKIHPNPFRDIGNYPIIPEKVAGLVRSIASEDFGMWESIIARPFGKEYEQAFGHHRIKAALECGLSHIPIIVKDLTDKQMLQYMGRENGEDYNTEFVVLLNTWEAGYNFLQTKSNEAPKSVAVARLLGWTTIRKDGHEIMTETANACDAGHKLIIGGYTERKKFIAMSVRSAKEIVERISSTLTTLAKSEKSGAMLPQHAQNQRHNVKAALDETLADVREGRVAPSKVREHTGTKVFTHMGQSKAPMPVPEFLRYVYDTCTNIGSMLDGDATEARLKRIEEALPHIRMDSDHASLTALNGALGGLGMRTENWRGRLRVKPATDVSQKNVARIGRK